MKREELENILAKHKKWLAAEGGSPANVSGAELSGAELSDSDLSDSNLSGAELSKANLSGANLSMTLYEHVDWLAVLGIVANDRGMARAYKLTKSNGEGPQYPGFNYAFHSIFTADEMCTDVNLQCAAGVNLATFRWCLNNKYGGERLFLMEFSTMPENVCVPVGSNGKFRVKKCRKVGECDWNGRLLSKTTKPEAE